ncbi:MAG: hypothetical protein ABFD96_05760 [Armatimonadia bacterium]
MTIPGLPPLDVPLHERDPHDCRRCKHSYYDSKDEGRRYLRCGRSQYSQQCRYERHETGDCKPEALHWKERGV